MSSAFNCFTFIYISFFLGYAFNCGLNYTDYLFLLIISTQVSSRRCRPTGIGRYVNNFWVKMSFFEVNYSLPGFNMSWWDTLSRQLKSCQSREPISINGLKLLLKSWRTDLFILKTGMEKEERKKNTCNLNAVDTIGNTQNNY